YTGVTSDLITRIWQHRNHIYPTAFTSRYNCNKLIYYCFYPRIEEATAEEKKIKGGSRLAKIKLIESINPAWEDLYKEINV
ncbi:GIY-YIG nuclease family protein, partial [Pedobacter sp. ASV12]